MERILSFNEKELYMLLYSIYFDICHSVETAALLHTHTIKNNNNFHFQLIVQEANEAIAKLESFLSPYDSRVENFKRLNKNKLIEEANHFLIQRDI